MPASSTRLYLGARSAAWNSLEGIIIYESPCEADSRNVLRDHDRRKLRGNFRGLASSPALDLLAPSRRHRRRAPSRAHVARRQLSARQETCATTGATTPSDFLPRRRAATPVSSPFAFTNIQGNGGASARCRQSKSSSTSSTTTLPRATNSVPHLLFKGIDNCHLLPADPGSDALLHQRYRHRETRSTSRISASCKW